MRVAGIVAPYILLAVAAALGAFGCGTSGAVPPKAATAGVHPARAPERMMVSHAGSPAIAADEANPEAATDDPDGYEASSRQIDDDVASVSLEVGVEVEHPLAALSTDQLEETLLSNPDSLGSMSLGTPNAGLLFNGVKMPEGELWKLVSPDCAWGTKETVEFITRSIESVASHFPGAPPLPIGHISSRRGGPLSPHVSHQSGRDVDLGYYYTDDSPWYTRARTSNLDRPRTWHLVRTLITETDVAMILVDVSLQRLLREYAENLGEDREWLGSVFNGVNGSLPPLIRHASGHATHIHVRFYNPIAQETARRVDDLLLKHDKISAPMRVVPYRAKKGDTLGKLARRFHTSVAAIKRANGLRSTLIRANVTYRIPSPTKGPGASAPVRIPRRRLPAP